MMDLATTKIAASAPPPADAAGLTEAEAARRLAQFGENALVEQHVSALERLARFFWGPIPWMIEIAALLSGVLRHWDDLAIILAMLFINAGVGFWQEFKADNAIALLKQRLALKARVKRGEVQGSAVPAGPGVPADRAAALRTALTTQSRRPPQRRPSGASSRRHTQSA